MVRYTHLTARAVFGFLGMIPKSKLNSRQGLTCFELGRHHCWRSFKYAIGGFCDVALGWYYGMLGAWLVCFCSLLSLLKGGGKRW